MMERYSIDLTTAAGLVSIYGIVALISYLPSGVLVDMFGPYKLSIFSYATTTVLVLVAAVTTDITVLRIVYVLLGITTILTFWSPWIASVSKAGGSENATKSFGYTYTFVGLGGIIVPSIMVKLVGNTGDGLVQGLAFLAVVTAILGILYAIVFKGIDNEEGGIDENSKFKASVLKDALKTPGLWYVGLVVFAFYALLATTSAYNQLLTDIYGMSNEQASMVAVLRTNGLGLIAGPILVFMVARIGSTAKTLQFTAIVEAFFIAALVLLPQSASFVVPAMIFVLVIAFCQLGARSIYFGQISEVGIPPHIIGTASGVISLVAYSSDVYTGPMVAAIITDSAGNIDPAGFKVLYMIQFALLALAFVSAMLVVKEANKAKKAREASDAKEAT